MVVHRLRELTDSTSGGAETELVDRLGLGEWWTSPGSGPSLDGPARVAGGLLGVVAGEAYAAGGFPGRGALPIAHALVDLTNAYVAGRGAGVPVEEARRHAGVEGPAWLLAVALTQPSLGEDLVVSTLLLAAAAGIGDDDELVCGAAYVQLASCVLMGMDPTRASVAGRQVLAGVAGVGLAHPYRAALTGAVCAVERGCSLRAFTELTGGDPPVPGVLAAVGGLLGLRDGVGGLPATWPMPMRSRADVEMLLPAVLRTRFVVEKASGRRVGERVG